MAYKNKEDQAAQKKAWREANKEKLAAYNEANKEKKAAYAKAYYEANKEKLAAKAKVYREVNKEKAKVYNKAWREANKEKIAAKAKAWREADKEGLLAKKKAYREANKEKIAANGKVYREANKEKLAAYAKAYREANKEGLAAYREANREKITANEVKRYNTEPLFKIKKDVRNLIAQSFRRQGYSKKSNTADILGCSFEELQSHLGEKTSNDHTDHIIPLTWAITEEEIYTLNHYSNLQILSAEENMAKGNRFTRLENVEKVLSLHNHPKKIQDILDRNQDKILV